MAGGGIVRELLTVWGFKVDDKPLQDAEHKVTSLKGTLAATYAVATGAAAGLFGLAYSVSKTASEASKGAQRLGMSTKQYQELEAAAHDAGLEQDSFNNAVKFLALNMNNAKQGSLESAMAFRRLGLDVNSAKGTHQMFLAVAERFSKLPNTYEKTALAVKLFGRAGLEVVPFLNRGSKGINELTERSRSLGLILDEATLKAGKSFKMELRDLKENAESLKVSLGGSLLPVFSKAMKQGNEYIDSNRELIKTKTKEFVDQLVRALQTLWKITLAGAQVLGFIIEKLGGMENAIKLLTAAAMVFLGIKFAIGIRNIWTDAKLAVEGLNKLRLALMAAEAPALALQASVAGAVAGLVMLWMILDDIEGTASGRYTNSVSRDMMDIGKGPNPWTGNQTAEGVRKKHAERLFGVGQVDYVMANPYARENPDNRKIYDYVKNGGPAPITVNQHISGAGDPKAVAAAVASATKNVLDDHVRGAGNSFARPTK